jgi:hypothetical protein
MIGLSDAGDKKFAYRRVCSGNVLFNFGGSD